MVTEIRNANIYALDKLRSEKDTHFNDEVSQIGEELVFIKAFN